eukprot:g150.t1
MRSSDYCAELSFSAKFEGKIEVVSNGKYSAAVNFFRKNMWRKEAEESKHFNFMIFDCFHENIVAKDAGKAESWDDVVRKYFKLDKCLVLVFDYDYVKDPSAHIKSNARRPRHKYVFLLWMPLKASKWEKRLFSIVVPKFRENFGTATIHLDLRASSLAEVTSQKVVKRLRLLA